MGCTQLPEMTLRANRDCTTSRQPDNPRQLNLKRALRLPTASTRKSVSLPAADAALL